MFFKFEWFYYMLSSNKNDNSPIYIIDNPKDLINNNYFLHFFNLYKSNSLNKNENNYNVDLKLDIDCFDEFKSFNVILTTIRKKDGKVIQSILIDFSKFRNIREILYFLLDQYNKSLSKSTPGRNSEYNNLLLLMAFSVLRSSFSYTQIENVFLRIEENPNLKLNKDYLDNYFSLNDKKSFSFLNDVIFNNFFSLETIIVFKYQYGDFCLSREHLYSKLLHVPCNFTRQILLNQNNKVFDYRKFFIFLVRENFPSEYYSKIINYIISYSFTNNINDKNIILKKFSIINTINLSIQNIEYRLFFDMLCETVAQIQKIYFEKFNIEELNSIHLFIKKIFKKLIIDNLDKKIENENKNNFEEYYHFTHIDMNNYIIFNYERILKTIFYLYHIGVFYDYSDNKIYFIKYLIKEYFYECFSNIEQNEEKLETNNRVIIINYINNHMKDDIEFMEFLISNNHQLYLFFNKIKYDVLNSQLILQTKYKWNCNSNSISNNDMNIEI